MRTATGLCVRLASCSAFSSRSWKLRWLKRPVSESVCAWCSSRARICALSSASAAASAKRFASSNSSWLNMPVLADPVDVEHALDLRAGDQRDRDERLGVDRRARHEADARIEVRLVDENRLPAAGRPAGHALVEADARPHDLVRVLVADDHRGEHALRLVGLVDRERVVRDQVGERVGDAHEQRVEALLREHLVEHVGEPPVRLDDRRLRGHAELLRQQPEVWLRAHYHARPIDLRCTCRRVKLLALEADYLSIAAARAVPIPHPREQVRRIRPPEAEAASEGGDRVAAARNGRSVRGSASAPPGTC